MSGITVEIEFPQDMLIGLRVEPKGLKRKAKEWMALELFREGEVSAGRAAVFLGITKSQFIDLLNEREIPYLDSTADELALDVETAQIQTSAR